MTRVQACVWSAVLDYEHMSGLQAADTVKQQAVQLASSKSQAASALAAQKASEQVSPYAGMQNVWSVVLSPVRFYTYTDRHFE